MRRFFSAFSAIAMLFALSAPADAITLIAYSNITSDTYVSGSGAVTSSFDINSLIPGGGGYNSPYNIVSATANFQFRDDGDFIYQGGTFGTFIQSPNNPYRSDRTIDVYYTNPIETAQVSMGGQTSTASTLYSEFTATEHTVSTSCAVQGPSGICYKYKYAHTWYNRHYSGYGAELAYGGRVATTSYFSLSQALGASALADLSADGIIDFTVAALTGDFKLLKYNSLTLVLEPNPVVSPPPATNPVPEPSTLLLLGSGMAGLGILRRFRK